MLNINLLENLVKPKMKQMKIKPSIGVGVVIRLNGYASCAAELHLLGILNCLLGEVLQYRQPPIN
jgi:hypothetical protein